MRKISLILLLCSFAMAQEQLNVFVAVTTATSKDSVSDMVTDRLLAELLTEVNGTGKYITVNRDEAFQAVVNKEKDLHIRKGVRDEDILAEGKELGAQYAFIIKIKYYKAYEKYDIMAVRQSISTNATPDVSNLMGKKLEDDNDFINISRELANGLLNTDKSGIFLDKASKADQELLDIVMTEFGIQPPGSQCGEGGITVRIEVTDDGEEEGENKCIKDKGKDIEPRYECAKRIKVSGYRCGKNRRSLNNILAIASGKGDSRELAKRRAKNNLNILNVQCIPKSCSPSFRDKLKETLGKWEGGDE